MREIFLIIMAIIAIISYFKLGYALVKLDGKEHLKGFLSLIGITFVCAISLLLNFTLIDMNDTLVKENKSKRPEYQEIKAYTLKKK
jgi:hypothetical protein